MLSLLEVKRAASALQSLLAGARLQRIVQPDEFRLAMEFYGKGTARFILFSCQPQFARVSLIEEMPKAPPSPPAFVQYCRANLQNALLSGITAAANDRRLGLKLALQERSYELILSILGPRSNIYLLDQNGILAYAMRPLAQTRRTLVIGQPWTDPDGSPKSAGEDRWTSSAEPAYLLDIEMTYAGLERKAALSALAGRIHAALTKEADSLQRKAMNLQQDMAEAVLAEDHRKKGDLLKTVLYSLPPEADSVTVCDFETGDPVVIPLEPRLTAAENLAAYYKRYQKELRGARMIRGQLERLRLLQDEIGAFQDQLKAMTPICEEHEDVLQVLAAKPRVRKMLTRYFPESRRSAARTEVRSGGKEIPSRLRPKRFRTDQGLEIWIGRSDEGNDYLTTRLARGNDWFFHLEGYPGSHVILRTEGRADPPQDSILDACELAVHFSRLKDARHADVHMAPVKNVRKPKGAKPGLVVVAGGKTVHLRRDAARLENILAARLDE